MLKSVLPILMFLFTAAAAFGQMCEPDQMYADSSSGVYPAPYDPDLSPDGGITECAIIGQPFSFDFTIVVGDTITFGAFSFPLDSIKINEVQGLPVGLNYICNPPNCTFEKNTLSCAGLFGTPTSANTPGEYELTIVGAAFVNGSPLPFPISFPDDNLAPGSYAINLLADDTTPCPLTAVSESFQGRMSMEVMPNPASGVATLEISSIFSGNFELRVLDLLGRTVHQEQVEVLAGKQNLQINCTEFSEGMHLVFLSNQEGYLTQKLMIQR
jgi:hypothetical protein